MSDTCIQTETFSNKRAELIGPNSGDSVSYHTAVPRKQVKKRKPLVGAFFLQTGTLTREEYYRLRADGEGIK